MVQLSSTYMNTGRSIALAIIIEIDRVVLKKTLKKPLDSKEIQQVNAKGNQS